MTTTTLPAEEDIEHRLVVPCDCHEIPWWIERKPNGDYLGIEIEHLEEITEYEDVMTGD